MLAASLERFLALRPKANGEVSNPVYQSSSTDNLTRKPLTNEPPVIEVSDDEMEIDQVNNIHRKRRRTKEDAMKQTRGIKRKAEFDDGHAKVKAIGIPDDLMSEDGELPHNPRKPRAVRKFAPRAAQVAKLGAKRKENPGTNHVKRMRLNSADEIVTDDESSQIQDPQLEIVRGTKRKAKRDHRISKIRRIGRSDEILTEDEGVPTLQDELLELSRSAKRKVRGDRRIRKTSRIGTLNNIESENEENPPSPSDVEL